MHKRILVLAAFLAVGGALVVGQAVPSGTGLIAYWTLNDATDPTALETAGSGTTNTGVYMGTTLPTTSASVPMVGGLAHPPGNTASRVFTQATANQWVEAPDAADLNLTGSFTLAAWVNPTGAQTNQMGIIEKFSTGTSAENGYFLRLNPAMIPKALAGNGTVQAEVQAPAALTAGVWSHVAATYDSATLNFRIYVNGGAPLATTSGVAAPTASTSPLHIGDDYGPNRFNGNIDDVRIYDRRLTDAEVGVLANGLPAPAGLTLTPGPGVVDVSWGAVANATSYRVEQGSSAAGPWVTVGTPTGTAFTDTTVINPTQYWYRVMAVGLIESQPSTVAGPVVPMSITPRTKDHEEGLFKDNCACGSTAAGPSPLLSLLLLAGLPLLRRRRAPLP